MSTPWLETHRGTVYRWEVDHNDHLTVAYYLSRFGDAALALLEDLDLGVAYAGRTRYGCVTADCYIRYLRELRVGDVMHVMSGVIAVEPDGLVVGHKLFDSADGALCTTAEHRLRHVRLEGARSAPLPATLDDVTARRITWDGPPREKRPRPPGLDGFRPTARAAMKPREADAFGRPPLSAFIHHFSAANGQLLASFGMTPAYMREAGRGFSTFEFQFAIDGDVGPGDQIAVRSALLHLGTSSMRMLHVMTDVRTGEAVATLEQLGVHFDQQARRPAPLPPELRARAESGLVRV